MKRLSTSLIAASMLIAANTQAAAVKTAGQALTLCKSHAAAEHTGYKRSISKKIRQNRAGFKLNMRIMTDEGSLNTVCKVAKDGTVSYDKA